MPMDLRLLQHALAVGRHGNFARAADSLGLTQPSLSRSIATLERSLGVALFDRTAKGVVPTAFGRVLLERGAALLQDGERLRQDVRALAGLEGGTLTVGAGPYPAETCVAAAIARLAGSHPRLRLRFIEADPRDIVRGVLEERMEVGIGVLGGPDRESALTIEPLPTLRFRLAVRAGHPLTREASLTQARILEYPLVGPVIRGISAALVSTSNPATAPAAAAAPRRIGDYEPAILVTSVGLGLRIVRDSDAVFPAPEELLAGDVAAGRLALLDFHSAALDVTASVFHLRDRTLSPAAAAFIEILHGVARAAAAPSQAR
jgi:DNA-binding transcriptional LysR family regulator